MGVAAFVIGTSRNGKSDLRLTSAEDTMAKNSEANSCIYCKFLFIYKKATFQSLSS
jgi:hypothetical protein